MQHNCPMSRNQPCRAIGDVVMIGFSSERNNTPGNENLNEAYIHK